MHPAPYARRLTPLPTTADFNLFRGRPHKFSWLTYTPPDLLAPVAILAEVTASTHTKAHTKALNKVMKASQDHPDSGLV